jgi:hypothetical protein
MSITKGYTFGATELVTNTKLHTLVDSATVDLTIAVALGTTTPSSGAFVSITATAERINNLTATGASIASSLFNALTATGISAASGNIDGTWRCDIFQLDQAPVTATASAQKVPFTCDSIFNIKLNGVAYYIPCSSASA